MNNPQLTLEHRKQRLGERRQSLCGSWMTIVKYSKSHDVTIKFDTGYVVEHVFYTDFLTGKIKDRLFPTVCGVGYIGVGQYNVSENGIKTLAYIRWHSMIDRCYGKPYKIKKSYEICTVCEEWHNFQNFAEWFENNYYEVPNQKMCVDKDILKKHNTVYSSENCCIVPERINGIFITHPNTKYHYPIGVSVSENQYTSHVSLGENGILSKKSGSLEETFNFYKTEKEKYIKQMADKYKQWLPDKVYQAMYAYEIDIND